MTTSTPSYTTTWDTIMLMAGSWTLGGRPSEKFVPSLSPLDERQVTELALDQAQEDADFVLILGAMDKPMAALRTCTDELLTHWGLDSATQRNLSRGVTPLVRPDTWLRSKDFPRDEGNSGKNAVVNYRLIIDSRGLPKACGIQGGTKGPAFQEATCRLLKERARFSPALNAVGTPVDSYYTGAVTWVSY